MTTDNIIEFTPVGEPMSLWDNLKFLLIFYAMVIGMHFVPLRHGGHISWAGTFFIGLGFSILLFYIANNPVRITLIKATATLQYDYLNFFGKERKKIIDLPTAYYEYKPYSGSGSRTMRLLMYNNYFRNKIELRASEKRGFSEEQLDALVEQIKSFTAQ